MVTLLHKTHQWLPSALWMKAKLPGAEKCLPVPPSSASSLSPPTLAPPSAARPPPPPSGEPHAQPGPRHLLSLMGTRLPASSPARLCLEPFPRPHAHNSHHFSVVPAAHDSSARPVGPTLASSHVLGAPTAATADLSSADSRCSEFVPQSVSAQTRTKSAIPAHPCVALRAMAVTTPGKRPSSQRPRLLRREQALMTAES